MAMEAVTINYLSMLHSMWTWIPAILTVAALSFWKMIKSSLHQHPLFLKSSLPPVQTSGDPDPADDQLLQEEEDLPFTPSATSSVSTTFCLLENNNIRRNNKFRVYYGEDQEALQQQQAAGRKKEIIRRSVMTLTSVVPPHPRRRLNNIHDGWEALINLKTPAYLNMQAAGWYRYQDLTLLDGSVVQLWNRSNQFNHPPSLLY